MDTLKLTMLACEFDLPEDIYTNKHIKNIRASDPNVYPRCLRIRFKQPCSLSHQLKQHSLCDNPTSYDEKEIWLIKYNET